MGMKNTCLHGFFILSLILAWGCNGRHAESESSGSVAGWEVSSSEAWLADAGLLNAESILFDSANQVFYVSNGRNYQPGTDGFISRISTDGRMLQLAWVDSLNRPTGMAIRDSFLYVADVNRLLVINTASGQILARYPEPVPGAGLNDVAISADGRVFVSASMIHAVCTLGEGHLQLWLQDSLQLQWANGLWVNADTLLVAGMRVVKIDLDTRADAALNLTPAFHDFDGIVRDGHNGYFLTTVEDSRLVHVKADGGGVTLMQDTAYFGDLEYVPQHRALYIPRGIPGRGAFFISVVHLHAVH